MELVRQILKQFDIPDRKYDIMPFHQGLINDTFFIGTGQEVNYVLQRVNEDVFQNIEALINNISLVLPFLDSGDYHKLSFVPTRENGIFLRTLDSGTWRMMHYVRDSRVYNVCDGPEVAREAGRILGRFHMLVPAPTELQLQDVIEDFHDLDLRIGQYQKALGEAQGERLSRADELIDFIDMMLTALGQAPIHGLPVRVCHNDTKLNNILFSNAGKGLCMIDLDTLMPGFFYYDFGDLAMTVVNPVAENEKDLKKMIFSLPMFQALVSGILDNEIFLTIEEIESLSWGVVYMPFLHGVRALTDYLSGDRYYKVKYPDENLDRARSLLHFSGLALDKREDMEKILDSFSSRSNLIV